MDTVFASILAVLFISTLVRIDGSTETCRKHLPTKLSEGIDTVLIIDYSQNNITVEKIVFQDYKWKLIKNLDITISLELKEFQINDNDFIGLDNLISLGIHSPKLSNITRNGLAGLHNLQCLDLTGCELMYSENIILPLTFNNSTPNLKTLELKETSRCEYFDFSITFYSMLQRKKIESLGLSGTTVKYPSCNSSVSLSVRHLDISNSTMYGTSKQKLSFFSMYKSLEVFNLSGIHQYHQLTNELCRDYINENITTTEQTAKTIVYCNMKLEVLDLSNINKDKARMIDNSFIDIRLCNLDIKTLNLSKNRIQKLNGTLILPKTLTIEILILASNGMQYLSPDIFETQPIKTLILSHNNLFKMQHTKHFIKLIQNLQTLEKFDISSNKFTFIPYSLFWKSLNLSVIVLSDNQLDTITFKIRHLSKLKQLHLNKNRIVCLDGTALNELKWLFRTEPENCSRGAMIDIRDNPIRCSCKCLPFIRLLHAMNSEQNTEITCTLEEKVVEIDEDAIEQSEYLCYRHVIIITVSVSVSIAFACVVVVTLVYIYTVRRRKTKNNIRSFISHFQANKLKENYLVFASYSSDDDLFARSFVMQGIKGTLQSRISERANDIVCYSDKDFRPGMPIICEIMRCIKESCVVVCIVSRRYCDSDWCRLEVKEAYEQNKPIILIFKERVDIRFMPPFIVNIFQRHARVQVYQVNGEYILNPSLDSLCQSVLYLASEQYQQSVAENKMHNVNERNRTV